MLQGRDMKMEEGMKLEGQLAGPVMRSEDACEGPTEFAQKRKPKYKGR
jgi:enoyl-CoA hydratase/carnithine racemase